MTMLLYNGIAIVPLLMTLLIKLSANESPSNNSTITIDKTNVVGTKLELCSLDPLTGWFR